MATKKVGLATGGVRDYASMAAYSSYVNALTFSAPEIVEVYIDSGAVADTTNVTISGWTGGSSTNTLTIRAATGEGFRDNASVLTNALRYNAANGAALTNSMTSGIAYTFGDNVIIDGLQIQGSNAAISSVLLMGAGSVMRNSLVRHAGSGYAWTTGGANTIETSVIHVAGGGGGININHGGLVVTSSLFISTGTTGGYGFRQLYPTTAAPLIKNTAVFNFTSSFDGSAHASSTNNATDAATFAGTNWGAAGQVSITSTEWVSLTSGSEDFRLASGSTKLKDHGATVGPTVDIIGITKPQGSSYDIGCSEYPVVDTTAPILSSPTGAATGNTTASASVSTDEAGTGYRYTLPAATATPSAATIIASGVSMAFTTGVQTFPSVTGLSADTLYKHHYTEVDTASSPNTATVVSSASFRTTGAVTFSGTVPTRNGSIGTAASFTNAGFFAGVVTPFAYTLQTGTLPAGLTLSSSTGIISGTPTTAGTQSGIVVRATDANSNTADTNAYSIVIASSNAAPTFPGSISDITGTNGVAITPVNVSGQFSDTDALAYTASPGGTAWPSGLVVNSSTGIISGTVATSTTTGLKVRATDTASQTVDSNAFNVTIAAVANATFTYAAPGKNIMGGLRTGVAHHCRIFDKVSGALLIDKTGLTSHATTGLTTFTVPTTTTPLGVEYGMMVVENSNNKDVGIFWCTPT